MLLQATLANCYCLGWCDAKLKSRDFKEPRVCSLVLYVDKYGFPVVMYGCESWTIKKAEC